MNGRVASVIDLLHRVPQAALATHSARMQGFPFVSAVAFAPEERHRPLLLMSRLAEHSRNLERDRRASLMLARSLGGGEIARATWVGEVVPYPAAPDQVERYLRYQPDAQRLLALGDFGFARFDAYRIQVIGGFAQAGWIEASALDELAHLEADTEGRLREQLAPGLPAGWTLIGIDPLGADLATPRGRERIAFDDGPHEPEAIPRAFANSVQATLTRPGSDR